MNLEHYHDAIEHVPFVPASQDALDGTSSALKKGGFVLTLRDGTAIDLMECDTDF